MQNPHCLLCLVFLKPWLRKCINCYDENKQRFEFIYDPLSKSNLIVRIAEATGVQIIDKAEKESETETFTFWQNERSPPSHGRVFKTTSIKINFRACFWKNFGSCPLRQALHWAQRFWSNTSFDSFRVLYKHYGLHASSTFRFINLSILLGGSNL